VLRYLAQYVFRIAITNSHIVGLNDRAVSFRYKHCQFRRWRTSTLEGEEFVRRFLQQRPAQRIAQDSLFGLWNLSKRHCQQRPSAPQHATCPTRPGTAPRRHRALPRQRSIHPPRGASLVQTAASAISSSSASSCQNSPKDRVRMPRGAPSKTIWETEIPKHTAHNTRVAGHRFEGLWK
jgi:hypothetical protein